MGKSADGQTDIKRNLDKCVYDVTLPRKEAIANILSHCSFQNVTEWIPFSEAYGRVLAQNMYSQNTLPNALTAWRDGVAVYYDRFLNGVPDTTKWVEGIDYCYINTGIGIKGDYDTEILIEQVYKDEDGHIHFTEAPKFKGQYTIPIGSDFKEGDLLARTGHTLTPALMGYLAKGGHVKIPVVKKPIVAFLPTGNELVAAGQPLPLRKTVEINSVTMRGKLLEWGAEPLIYPICKDNRAQLKGTLVDALGKADIVILNAGSSKGTDDFSHEVLYELGVIFNEQVDTGPGKHTCYALANNKPIVGLSGIPAGCEYSSEWYVRPIIDLFLGRSITKYPRFQARLLTDLVMTYTSVDFMMGAHVMRDAQDQLVVAVAQSIEDTIQLENKVNCFIPMLGMNGKAGDTIEIEMRLPFLMPVYEPDIIAMVNPKPVIF